MVSVAVLLTCRRKGGRSTGTARSRTVPNAHASRAIVWVSRMDLTSPDGRIEQPTGDECVSVLHFDQYMIQVVVIVGYDGLFMLSMITEIGSPIPCSNCEGTDSNGEIELSRGPTPHLGLLMLQSSLWINIRRS